MTRRTKEQWQERIRVVKEQLHASRADAWLPCDVCAGRLVSHFTPKIWIFLQAAGNRFITGDLPFAGDAAQFLWAIRREGDIYEKPDRRFFREAGNLDWVDLVNEIRSYLDRQLMDLPIAGDGESSGTRSSMKVAHWVSYWVHRYAELYKWEVEYIMSQSISRLCQLDKIDRVANKDGSGYVDKLTTEMAQMVKEASRDNE